MKFILLWLKGFLFPFFILKFKDFTLLSFPLNLTKFKYYWKKLKLFQIIILIFIFLWLRATEKAVKCHSYCYFKKKNIISYLHYLFLKLFNLICVTRYLNYFIILLIIYCINFPIHILICIHYNHLVFLHILASEWRSFSLIHKLNRNLNRCRYAPFYLDIFQLKVKAIFFIVINWDIHSSQFERCLPFLFLFRLWFEPWNLTL